MNNVKEIRQFITAGNAKFVLVSPKSNKHISYTIKLIQNETDTYYVFHDYKYLGILKTVSKFKFLFILTRKSPDPGECINTGSMLDFIDMLNSGSLPSDIIEFKHIGYCGRCGRELTDPKSIEIGIGPYCLTQL